MIFKVIVILLLLAILFSLGNALYHLVHKRGASHSMVKALTVRISLSIGLFILLIVAFALGWITPHSI